MSGQASRVLAGSLAAAAWGTGSIGGLPERQGGARAATDLRGSALRLVRAELDDDAARPARVAGAAEREEGCLVLTREPDERSQLGPVPPRLKASADWGRVRADVLRLPSPLGPATCRLQVRSAWHVVLLVLEGGGASLELPDGKVVPLRPGRLDAVPPGQEFLGRIRLSDHQRGSGPAWLVLRLEPSLVATPPAAAVPRVLTNLRDPILRAVVASLRTELEQQAHPDPRLMADATGMLVLARLALAAQRGGTSRARRVPPLPEWRLLRAMTHARENLDRQDLSIDGMASAAGLSPWHFARAFKLAVGVPPHRWVLAQRMERARELLAEGRLSLAEVALAVGLSSQSHLNQVFSKAFGCPPGVFRSARRAAQDPTPDQARAARA